MLILIAFLIATPCLTYVLYNMIQPGNVLEWWTYNVVDKIYSRNRFLAMFLGDCDKCFANFISQVSFIVFLAIQYQFEWWGWWNILVWFLYFPLCIVGSVFIINFLRNLGKITELEERVKKLEDGVRM